MKEEKILLTGGGGQLGTVLRQALNEKYGTQNVILSDVREIESDDNPFEILNVADYEDVVKIIKKHKVTKIFHLAAILSASGEANPALTRMVNSTGFFNILTASVECNVGQVFYPSSIAVFGPEVPKEAPQDTMVLPTTVYGVTKINGEKWAHYFHQRYGLDVRSLRYPGVIGYQSMPGGGTTDYAVTIFHSALKKEKFGCFLAAKEYLPMIYMDDAIRATLELMDADERNIKTRHSYNISGLSFCPEELAAEIKKHVPDFEIDFIPDERQIIASSWPDIILDDEARADWNWKPRYDLAAMVEDMFKNLSIKYKK